MCVFNVCKVEDLIVFIEQFMNQLHSVKQDERPLRIKAGVPNLQHPLEICLLEMNRKKSLQLHPVYSLELPASHRIDGPATLGKSSWFTVKGRFSGE